MAFPASPPELPGVAHQDVVIDQTRWHVATAGEGPPVVLLHGWPQNWWIWRHVMPDLAQDHRVIAPDMRGFGWSDAPAGSYSKAGLAADVEKLLDALDIERCVLVGHDWGGFVAWLTALRATERIERLVTLAIIHPWFKLDFDPLAALATLYQPLLSTPVLGTAVMRHTPLLKIMLRMGVHRLRWDRDELNLYADSFRRPDHARAAAALYRTFLLREFPALLRGQYADRRLDIPVTMAAGEHDPVVTPKRVNPVLEHAPNARRVLLDGVGHFLPEEDPARVIDLIRG